MERHKIPTAVYASFKNPAMAAAYINEIQHRIILKADGITDGDAVFIPDTKIGAVGEMRNVLSYELFGSASSSVIVEEHLAGDEVSVLTFSDGKAFKSFPPCQPHKRIFERNRGPNTVGMGSYSPVPWLSRGDLADIDQKIIQPTFRGFQSEGWYYWSFLT